MESKIDALIAGSLCTRLSNQRKAHVIFRQVTSALFLTLQPLISMLCHCLYKAQQQVQDVSVLSDAQLGVDHVPSPAQCLRTYRSVPEGHYTCIGCMMQH